MNAESVCRWCRCDGFHAEDCAGFEINDPAHTVAARNAESGRAFPLLIAWETLGEFWDAGYPVLRETSAMSATPRERLAWLMWCFQEGYVNAEDRAGMGNWLLDDPATLHPDDAKLRPHLLAMADEVLDGPDDRLEP